MLVIGEKINGMYKAVGKAIVEKDKKTIQDLAQAQIKAGSNYLDVNTGPSSDNPLQAMEWLVETIQEVTDTPLCLDTTKPEVMEAGLKKCKNKAMINSTTGQQEKLDVFLPLAAKYKVPIIGLAMDEKGIPRDAAGRTEIAMKIIAAAMEQGIPTEDVYIDPLILPVNVAQTTPGEVLEALGQLKILSDPPPKSVLGLSNVSQGTQKRELINRTYLIMALAAGMDAAIVDPLDDDLMEAMVTTELLLNKHIYCDDFLKAYRGK